MNVPESERDAPPVEYRHTELSGVDGIEPIDRFETVDNNVSTSDNTLMFQQLL